MSVISASQSNDNAANPPGAWVTWQQECFQMQPKKKSCGKCCGVTIPVPALTNGLQGILRDGNDDMRV